MLPDRENKFDQTIFMTKSGKPNHPPSQSFPPAADALHREGGWLRIPLRGEWRDVTAKPEEVVRQKFIAGVDQQQGSRRIAGARWMCALLAKFSY